MTNGTDRYLQAKELSSGGTEEHAARQGSDALRGALWRYFQRHEPAHYEQLRSRFAEPPSRELPPTIKAASPSLADPTLTAAEIIATHDERKLGRALTDQESIRLQRALSTAGHRKVPVFEVARTPAKEGSLPLVGPLWTWEEKAQIRRLLKQGKSFGFIALKLSREINRSYDSIYQKARSMVLRGKGS